MQTEVAFLLTFSTAWVSLYLRQVSSSGKAGFNDSKSIHIFHSIATSILATTVLCLDADEALPTLFSGSYFVVDLVDCLIRKDMIFLAHAIISLVLCIMGYAIPELRAIKLASRGLLCELSTPLLYRWQRTKTKMDFTYFCIVFTVVRPIWLGFVLREVLARASILHTAVIVFCSGLYALQIIW
jgi:hypothetical protein